MYRKWIPSHKLWRTKGNGAESRKAFLAEAEGELRWGVGISSPGASQVLAGQHVASDSIIRALHTGLVRMGVRDDLPVKPAGELARAGS